MEGDKHFSHDHRLILVEHKEVDDYFEDDKAYLCSICGLPILSSPSYTCNINGCNFFLHKPCAELPEQLYHPTHDPETFASKILLLKPNLPSRKNFTYKCEGCEFDVHPFVVRPVEIKIQHKSHPMHPLIAICRETSSRCDACGEEQDGFFFFCQECNFWVHQDCTLLPSIVKQSSCPYPFILTYYLPSYSLSGHRCVTCDTMLRPRYSAGVYYCAGTRSFAHVTCAMSSMEILDTETKMGYLLQLPDEEDTFSRFVNRYEDTEPSARHDGDDDGYHEHPLILSDGISSTSNDASCNLVCDVCIKPIYISSPFYRCQLQTPSCHFHAHISCENFFRTVKFHSDGGAQHIIISNPSRLVFNSVFFCSKCHRPCNGLCEYLTIFCGSTFKDLECIMAPPCVVHASHRQHVLFETRGFLGMLDSTNNLLSCCSGRSLLEDVYGCLACNFYIHARCAWLPKRTWHNKFDEHPLELIMMKKSNEDAEDEHCCICEVCEEDIDCKYWYYGCGECEQYFHINCIPSVGYLSKVKFGKPLIDDNIHHHPVTLTRMLTVGRHEMCGSCNKIIKGFVDEMAFHCSQCDFWIHFSCARDSSSASHMKVYQEVEKEYEGTVRAMAIPLQIHNKITEEN